MDVSIVKNHELGTHTFITNHPIMNQLGLGSFTTGTLYEWMSQRDPKNGFLVNRSAGVSVLGYFLTRGDGAPITHFNDIFDFTPEAKSNQCSFSVWRKKEGGFGVYEQKTLNGVSKSDWDYQEAGISARYDWDNVRDPLKNEYYNEVDASSGNVLSIQNSVDRSEIKDFRDGKIDTFSVSAGATLPVMPVSAKLSKGDPPDLIGEDMAFLATRGSAPPVADPYNPLLNIINAHDYINSLKTAIPVQGEEGEYRGLTDILPTGDRDKFLAINRLIKDIKSSKYRSIVCSGHLGFNMQMAGGQFTCFKDEWVTFNLYLHDKKKDKNAVQVVSKSNKIADFKRDETGREYKSREDGDVTPPEKDNAGEKVVADLDMIYDPVNNKFTSGSTNLVAKMVTAIDKATMPSVDELEAQDTVTVLDSTAKEDHIIPQTGLAMPFYPQNGNPRQWSPNYAEDSNCRDAASLEKQKLTVFNFNDAKSYSKDETVLLSKIGGVWQVIDLGSGIKPVPEFKASFAGQWQFQYIFETYETYFNDRSGGGLGVYTPQLCEQIAHYNYYSFDPKNIGENGKGLSFPLSNFSNTITRLLRGDKHMMQFTSFDCVHDQMYGRNPDGHGIAQTIASITPADQPIPLGDVIRNAAHTAGFFGAVFPRGWDLEGEWGLTAVRDYHVRPVNSGAVIEQNPTDPVMPGDSQGVVLDSPQPINTKLSESFFYENYDFVKILNNQPVDNPFFEPQNAEQEEDPSAPGLYDPNLSLPRSAVGINPWQDVPEDDTWIRNTGRHCASMLYRFNEASDSTMEHLPADIGCNGHITSQYGGPIYNIHRTHAFYRNRDLNVESNTAPNGEPQDHQKVIRDKMHRAFFECTWLRKGDTLIEAGEAPELQQNTSAFAFKPKSPGLIQFRPLKQETYCGVDVKILDWAAGNWTASDNNGSDSQKGIKYIEGVNQKNIPGELALRYGLSRTYTDTAGNLNDFYPDARHYHNGQVHRQMVPIDDFGTDDQQAFMFNPLSIAKREKANCGDNIGIIPNSDMNGIWTYTEESDSSLTWGTLQLSRLRASKFDQVKERGLLKHTNAEVQGLGVKTRIHERNFWATDLGGGLRTWRGDAGALRGGGNIGVVAASCNVKYSNTITFSTVNYFGMGSSGYTVRVSLYFGFFGGGLRSVQEPAWGGGSEVNRLRGRNTYHLAATVMQGHPREQTVFDGSYFCVHHFNPRPDLAHVLPIPKSYTFKIDNGYTNSAEASKELFQEVTSQEHLLSSGFAQATIIDRIESEANPDPENDPISKTIVFPFTKDQSGNEEEGRQIASVGIRHPSVIRSDFTVNDWAHPIPTGVNAFRDEVDGMEGFVPCPENAAYLDTSRYGKLLPFNHYEYRWGAPVEVGTEFNVGARQEPVFLASDIPDDGQFARERVNEFCLVDEGNGQYSVGDIIGNPTYGIEFQVTALQSSDITGPIATMECIKNGDNFDATNAVSAHAILDKDNVVGVNLRTISAANGGDGFEMRFFNARTFRDFVEDKKPLTLIRDEQLSADADNTQRIESYNSVAQQFGYVSENKEYVLTIDPDKVSDDNFYDLFFHAHNDCDFVFMGSESNLWGNSANPFDVDENYIQLEIGGA